MGRIEKRFASLKADKRAGLVAYFSAGDPDEVRWAQTLEPCTRLMVATEGAAGGTWWGESEGRWQAAPLPGPVRDSYGAGDSFAAVFTLGLGRGDSIAAAAHLGAEAGARALTRQGVPWT